MPTTSEQFPAPRIRAWRLDIMTITAKATNQPQRNPDSPSVKRRQSLLRLLSTHDGPKPEPRVMCLIPGNPHSNPVKECGCSALFHRRRKSRRLKQSTEMVSDGDETGTPGAGMMGPVLGPNRLCSGQRAPHPQLPGIHTLEWPLAPTTYQGWAVRPI